MIRSNPSAPGPTLLGSFQNATFIGLPIAANASKEKAAKKWYEGNTIIYIAIAIIVIGGITYFLLNGKKS